MEVQGRWMQPRLLTSLAHRYPRSACALGLAVARAGDAGRESECMCVRTRRERGRTCARSPLQAKSRRRTRKP